MTVNQGKFVANAASEKDRIETESFDIELNGKRFTIETDSKLVKETFQPIIAN